MIGKLYLVLSLVNSAVEPVCTDVQALGPQILLKDTKHEAWPLPSVHLNLLEQTTVGKHLLVCPPQGVPSLWHSCSLLGRVFLVSEFSIHPHTEIT